jgi:chemotaxis protein MotB
MPAAAVVSDDEIRAAINAVAGRGEAPTNARLRAELEHRGDPFRLQRVVNQWWAENGPRVVGGDTPEAADPIPRQMRGLWRALLELLKDVQDEAAAEASQALATERAGLRAREAGLDDDRTALHAEHEVRLARLAEREDAQEALIATLRADLDSAGRRAETLDQDLRASRQDAAEAREAHATLKAESAAQATALQAVREELQAARADAQAARNETATVRMQAVDLARDLQAAKAAAATAEDLRRAAQKRADELASANAALKLADIQTQSELAGLREKLATSKEVATRNATDLAATTAVLESTRKELAELHRQTATRISDFERVRANNAVLHAELKGLDHLREELDKVRAQRDQLLQDQVGEQATVSEQIEGLTKLIRNTLKPDRK